MTDIMLDTETLGKRAGCAILSVGACTFNPHTGEIDQRFYANVNYIESVQRYDFHIDPETVDWWFHQSEEARQHLSTDKANLETVLSNLALWFSMAGGVRVWSQGAAFDFPILEEAFRRCGIAVPWKFWNVRDTRTVYDINNFDPRSVPRSGTYHNALHDCEHQVLCVKEALKRAV